MKSNSSQDSTTFTEVKHAQYLKKIVYLIYIYK